MRILALGEWNLSQTSRARALHNRPAICHGSITNILQLTEMHQGISMHGTQRCIFMSHNSLQGCASRDVKKKRVCNIIMCQGVWVRQLLRKRDCFRLLGVIATVNIVLLLDAHAPSWPCWVVTGFKTNYISYIGNFVANDAIIIWLDICTSCIFV